MKEMYFVGLTQKPLHLYIRMYSINQHKQNYFIYGYYYSL